MKKLIISIFSRSQKEEYANKLDNIKREFEKTLSEPIGIYNTQEKQTLYRSLIEPRLDRIKEVGKNETVVYFYNCYNKKLKKAQSINTVPKNVWHYIVNDNLIIKKIKTNKLFRYKKFGF